MSPSIFVQFDREVIDADRLLADLRSAGIPALSVSQSRWVRRDTLGTEETDAGPRLDVEIPYQARPAAAVIIAQIESFVSVYTG